MMNSAFKMTIVRCSNQFALPYSVFLSLWSTVFLEQWTRYENELKFRWGSEGFEALEMPRPQFRGMLDKSKETGIEKMVHKVGVSMYKRTGRIGISWTLSCYMILATGTAATNAYLVREIGKGGVRNITYAGPGEAVCDFCGTPQEWEGHSTNTTDPATATCDRGLLCPPIGATHPTLADACYNAAGVAVGGTLPACPAATEVAPVEEADCVEQAGCVYNPALPMVDDANLIENGCEPYSTTHLTAQTTEDGDLMYGVPNLDATTASGLGTMRCTGGTLGWPKVRCMEDGGKFTELTGCSMPTSWQANRYKYGSSFVSLFCIQIASRTYKPMAVKLTDWENHRTQTEYDDSLVVKNFMFEFINNYFTLFFIAFLMGNIDIPFKGTWDYLSENVLKEVSHYYTDLSIASMYITLDPNVGNKGLFPDEMTPCQNSKGETMTSCMGIIQRQLFIVFSVKQLASLTKQWIKPKISERSRVKKENSEIITKNKLRARGHAYPLTIENQFEKEKFLAPYASNFDDFKEMSVQFG